MNLGSKWQRCKGSKVFTFEPFSFLQGFQNLMGIDLFIIKETPTKVLETLEERSKKSCSFFNLFQILI
ncbi:hypothetical protein [Flavobacterium sp. F52]|uniref:hypothetical protein n=1 Tax=Flavobacterium sp. F52 TaxID=1202532 RepID=UPI0002730583|nr:hypothetical protein [Flavobacterium sp. F52]EJG01601.1 hypothetical protein FF52_11093 [Flavobacterium sp. F52]